jgi:hypothetical protein
MPAQLPATRAPPPLNSTSVCPPRRYDAIHNAHLGLAVLGALYAEAKVLADAVIPNE